MKLGYDLTIEQTQKLTMTPELIQAIQILQFNTQELDEFVQDELMQNPVLEFDKTYDDKNQDEVSKSEEMDVKACEQADIDLREKVKEAEYDDISYKQWEYSKDKDDEYSYEQFVSKDETLEDSLLLQLTFSSLKGQDLKIGRYLVEAIDDNGYLTVTTEEVAKVFQVDVDKVEEILDVIQTFEPAGVGARDLKECLIIQLAARGLLEDTVEYIILHHLEDLGENKLNKVARTLGLPIAQVQMVCDLIRSLEPKPGRSFSSGSNVKYITPDVTVEKIDGEYQVITNEYSAPRLMVSPYYSNLASTAVDDAELNKYLNEKYNAAIWLIKSIEQRKHTIFNVVDAVIRHQKDFFDYGPKYLKTLTLKQVAEDLGIHESTVSRAINGKYMQTPRGVFEIKYFFSSGVTGSDGEGVSSNSIKSMIKEIINGEDPKNPYSDQDMVKLLSDRGIEISRRTVAKYREGLNIPSSSKRRRY
ncbi:MAG: RNA polymerase factor sigma-54 [Firmicutes bacterium]|nr:RNA polymerase factor sigma-54 [Bacillota bacterium]MDD7601889.1 RNA polymerase factor sigma-54 [Bacillota bacterium]MDY5855905.1 RNA polymerase factor sigma-54 [Anaerovoracaceae bacterium]